MTPAPVSPLSSSFAFPSSASFASCAAGKTRKPRRLVALAIAALCLPFAAPCLAPFVAPCLAHAQTATPGGQAQIATGFGDPFVAADAAGNVYVTDSGTMSVKKLVRATNGTYTTTTLPITLASQGFGIAVDASGQLYIGLGNGNIVRYTPSGAAYTGPVNVATAAAQGTGNVYSLAVDTAGNVYIPDCNSSRVLKETLSGGTYIQSVVATAALGIAFNTNTGIGLDSAGNLYIGDYGNSRVIKETLNSGAYTASLVLNGVAAFDVAIDAAGSVYVPDINSSRILKETPSGGAYAQTVLSTNLPEAKNVTLDAAGNLYASGGGQAPVFEIGTASPVAIPTAITLTSTLSASFLIGTAGTLPALSNANVLTLGTSGLDYTLGAGSTCTGAVATGSLCTVSVNFTPRYPGQRLGAVNLKNTSGTVIATAFISGTGNGPLATLSPGLISTVAGNGVYGYTASQDTGTTPATAATLNAPVNVATDAAGNLYISDLNNNRIRKVAAATGTITTVAGNGTAGYTASQDTGTGAATAASLNLPESAAVDGAGNLYIADQQNQRIRKVAAATGFISTVAGNGTSGYTASQDTGTTAATAASISYPSTVVVDGSGNLYFTDQANQRVRKVTAATGFISTVAGNGTFGYTASQDTGSTLATAASLSNPDGLAIDSAGNLYISDIAANRIRKVTAATGFISSVAGNGTAAFTGDGAAATSASLSSPYGLAVDAAGNLYIGDQNNARLRKVTAATGIISTVGGTGGSVYAASQDTGTTSATAAVISFPTGIALDAAGNLYVADQANHRIRKVSAIGDIVFPTATTAGTADSTDGTKTLTFNNIGNTTLTFTTQVESGFSFLLGNPMTGGCSAAIPVSSGASCLIGATFAPVAGSSGLVTGQVALTDNSLNATAATQNILLLGSTSANSVLVTVNSMGVVTGSSTVTITFTYGGSGTAGDTGAPSATVNGSTTGVGAITCFGKPSHQLCSFPYTGTALATPGNYPIVISVAAASPYAAGSANGTLRVSASGAVAPIGPPVQNTIAPVEVLTHPATSTPVPLAPVWSATPSPTNDSSTDDSKVSKKEDDNQD